MPVTEYDERDDFPLMPPQIPRSQPIATTTNHPSSRDPLTPSVEPELRPGDPGDDRPEQIPRNLTRLSEADLETLRHAEETSLLREMREAEELLHSEPTVFGLHSMISHPVVGAVVIAFGGILGIFLFNQVTSVLTGLATLPTYWQYAGWAGLGLLGAAVLYAILRFIWFYLRLRRNKQLRIRGLEELEKRTRMRWLVHAKIHEAKQQLQVYLREFPLENRKDRKRLTALGITDETIQQLEGVRQQLLSADAWPSDDVWFAAFRDQFQSRLDDAAATRVKYWSRRTAVATAISPNTLTDTAMTLYFSFTMLGDLCAIYNLRAGRLGTMVLLARVFFNSYLAGQINEMENLTAEQIQNLVTPHLPVSELLVAKVLGKVGAKAGAGVVNYFLLARLGKYGTQLLRPVSRD